MYVYRGLTVQLEGWENRGWANVANSDILRRVVAKLRQRGAATYLKWVKGHSGIEGNEGADELAAAGAAMNPVQLPPLGQNDRKFLLPGAKLAGISQKFAYESILQWKNAPLRRRTECAVSMIKEALNDDFALNLGCSRIWSNVWGKEIAVKTSVFFWKMMHDAYRVREYWKNIPGYENRAICPVCNVEETMYHILKECSAPGQELVWGLALRLLERRGVTLPSMTFGAILGAPSLETQDVNGDRCPGQTRLLRIVLSESLHLVWKLRCERVIQWDEPGKMHSTAKITNLWYKIINERLRLDMERTKAKWKKRRLPVSTVLDTWRGTIHDEAALPEDWTKTAGVLVGTLHDGNRHRTR
ncbi:hypothetical protein C2E23DRAFT_717188 [Lenzites betulinus]|nr:hypothetical protein C2E23DRAFT_717188 [Lenzites betulinus]